MKCRFILILVLIIILSGSCRKNHQLFNSSHLPNAIQLSNDADFIRLNEAIKHFDAVYIITTSGRQSDTIQLQRSIDSLLQKVFLNNFSEYRSELFSLCNISSPDILKTYLNDINSSLDKLSSRYHFSNTILSAEGKDIYISAKQLFAKTKIKNYPTVAGNTTGSWKDFVDNYFREFDYYVYLYDHPSTNNLLLFCRNQ